MRLFACRVFVFVSILLFWQYAASACEPCAKPLNLFDTADKADIIVLGEKYKEGRANSLGQPEDIEVKVLKVLKGEPAGSLIKVNSWDGACPYGIVMDESHYVLFLQKSPGQEEDYQYDAVDHGCSVKAFRVTQDIVDFNGMLVPIDVFVSMLRVKHVE